MFSELETPNKTWGQGHIEQKLKVITYIISFFKDFASVVLVDILHSNSVVLELKYSFIVDRCWFVLL